MSRGRAFVLTAAIGCASCATPLMKLPTGPGIPATDTAEAFTQATRTCRTIRTLTAEVAVSGSAGGRRFRGRLSAGVAAPASVRLEAMAPFGPPVFIFVATGEDATLLLPRDARVLEHGRPDTVLEAVTGVPLGAADLHAALTGCASSAPSEGRRLGDHWRGIASADGGELYLRREAAGQPWRLVAAMTRPGRQAWRAEFRDHQGDLPRTIRVTSVEPGGRDGAAFDVRLALTQVETNIALGAEVFRVQVPSTAHPISVDELRDARTGIRKN